VEHGDEGVGGVAVVGLWFGFMAWNMRVRMGVGRRWWTHACGDKFFKFRIERIFEIDRASGRTYHATRNALCDSR